MAFTVSDCLNLPALTGAKVVSGHKGLGRIVNNVSVLEFFDVSMFTNKNMFTANELLLTAFHAIKDDVDTQVKTIELLHRSGDIGIIIYYLGYILDEIDPRVIEKSNELDFPIITMPEGPRFEYRIAISDIMEAIFHDRQRETRFTNALLERLSQLPEHQRIPYNAIQMLSEQLRSSIILMDTAYNCLHYFKTNIRNPITENQIQDIFVDREFTDKVDTVVIKRKNNNTVRVHRIPFTEKNFSHLSLIIIDDFGRCEKEDLYCAVEVLQLFSQIWKKPLDAVKPNALIPAILTDNSERTYKIAQSLNINLKKINTMLIIRIEDMSINQKKRHKMEKDIMRDLHILFDEYRKSPIFDVFTGMLVALMDFSTDDVNDNNFLDDLQNLMGRHVENFTITICNNMIDTENVKKAFTSYNQNIDYLKQAFPNNVIFNSSDIHFITECLGTIRDKNDSYHYTEKTINLILNEDDGREILETFLVYLLDAKGSAKNASQLLYVHKNTVQYRINKIKHILNLRDDLNKMPEAYIVYKAAAIYRLGES